MQPDLNDVLADLELDLEMYGMIRRETFERVHQLLHAQRSVTTAPQHVIDHWVETGHRWGKGCCAGAPTKGEDVSAPAGEA